MAEQQVHVERVELDLDEGLARWLRGCADRRGVDPSAIAGEALRALQQAEQQRTVDELLDEVATEREAVFDALADPRGAAYADLFG